MKLSARLPQPPYQLNIPECQTCGKRLTPSMVVNLVTSNRYARVKQKADEFCCGKEKEIYENEPHVLMNVGLGSILVANQDYKRGNLKTSIRVRYAIEQTVSTSWVGLLLYSGAIKKDIQAPAFMELSKEEELSIRVTRKDKEKRISGRLIRMVRHLLPDELAAQLTDADFELFHNQFTASLAASKFTWSVVSGEDIREWYLERTYANHCGTLNNSCMRYSKSQNLLDLYVENPNQISLLVAVSDVDKKLHGRALVYKLQSGEMFVSRPYGNDVMQQQINQYAVRKGWLLYGVHEARSPVAVENVKFRKYPYVDYFGFINMDKKELRTEQQAEFGDFIMDEISGILNEYEPYEMDDNS